MIDRGFATDHVERRSGRGVTDDLQHTSLLRRWAEAFWHEWEQTAQAGRALEGLLIALVLAIFALDVELPRGAAPEFLYSGAIYFSLWSRRRGFPVLMTCGCTIFTVLGAGLSAPGTLLWVDLANRFFATVVMWITLELGVTRREAHQALQQSHAELESMVRQRTAELSHAIEALQAELAQRTEAERLLAESREESRMLFEHAPYPMWVVDLESLQFLDVNETAVRHYGYSREEFLAMTIKDIRPPEDIPRLLQALQTVKDTPRAEGVWRHRKKDGSLIDVELGLYSLDYAGRRARLTVVNDVTESKRLLDRLTESEERFRKVFDEAPIGMGIVGTDGRFLRVNGALCSMVGYAESELTVKTFSEITHPDDLEHDLRLAQEVFEGIRRSYQIEKRYLTKSGGVVWGHLTVAVLREGNGKPGYALGMIKNISERKRAEAIRTRLLNKIMVVQEEERRHVARELHDGIGQILTGLAVGLRSLEDGTRPELLVPQARRLRQVATDAVEEVRRIARGLRPSVLDDLGLEEALRQYVWDYIRSYGIEADVQFMGEKHSRLPNVVETALYRIIQEAMTNAAKHAAARHVSVVLHRGDSVVTTIIEDDGCGFEGEGTVSGGPSGLGIPGMRERASLLNGTVEIESSPGKGTTIYVWIPVKEGAP